MEFDLLVFIGRFSPFHVGHKKVIDEALSRADRVLVLIGSANRSRDFFTPFSYEEREELIRLHYKDNTRLIISPLNDYMYNDTKWVLETQRTVVNTVLSNIVGNSEKVTIRGLDDVKIGLIGCSKDNTSFYLKLFPTWESVAVDEEFISRPGQYDTHKLEVSGTNIRNTFFNPCYLWGYMTYRMLGCTDIGGRWLTNFRDTDTFKTLVSEFQFVEKYKESVKKYPRIEHTVDSVVIQSGQILLVKRRSVPGKGMWALPGGFVNLDETLLEAAIRELKEETKLKVPEAVLKGSLVKSDCFDNPRRSARARIITQAFLFKLEDKVELPKVKGSSDAEKAKWVPLSELNPHNLFEDHYFIIQKMIGYL